MGKKKVFTDNNKIIFHLYSLFIVYHTSLFCKTMQRAEVFLNKTLSDGWMDREDGQVDGWMDGVDRQTNRWMDGSSRQTDR